MNIAAMALQPVIHFTKGAIRICVSSTIQLQPNTETLVPCTLQHPGIDQDLILVSQASSLSQRDLAVAPAIVSSQQPTLLVANPTNQPQTLYAGMHIAKATILSKEHAKEDNEEHGRTPVAVTCATATDIVDPSYRIDLDNCDLTPAQRDQLRRLQDSYADVFSRHRQLHRRESPYPYHGRPTCKSSTIYLTHLPFGLKSAGSYFARIMSKVLGGLEGNVLTYIDDILVVQ
ncbi:hypothetical protein OSTOST_26006 [Ostertagia ostertagi]